MSVAYLTPPPTDSESSKLSDDSASPVKASRTKPAPIWWSNAIFFVSMHVLAIVGILYLSPYWKLDHRTAWLCVASWQLATFGITMGYHRLWSHRAFQARMPLRIILAGMGCLGFQGSIKWWVLRHRLHHRFTDSDDDPYDASKGLWFSHVGWIFRKPSYPRMSQIDRRDLDADPVVRFQHKYYIPLTLGLGLVLPTLVGATYGDALGGYIWGGVVARLLIWHCTFLINCPSGQKSRLTYAALAHYLGEQNYSLDVTARGNFVLALLTGGESLHNFHHAFPKDYRNGPQPLDWDPTKLLIWACSRLTPWVSSMHVTPQHEILEAQASVLQQHAGALRTGPIIDDADLPTWPIKDVVANVTKLTEERMSHGSLKRPLVVLIDGYAVDVGAYATAHPGGYSILRAHAVHTDGTSKLPIDSSDAFNGGSNNHGSAARRLMRDTRIAKVV